MQLLKVGLALVHVGCAFSNLRGEPSAQPADESHDDQEDTVLLSDIWEDGMDVAAGSQGQATQRVNAFNFYRAETDRNFGLMEQVGAFGKFVHNREPVRAGEERVIGMQQDTLYGRAVVDLDAGPVTVTMPDNKGRFQSLMPLSQDHDVFPCYYGPGVFTFTRGWVGTRYLALIVRTFMDATDQADIEESHKLQDDMLLGAGKGIWEPPAWDQDQLLKVQASARRMLGLGGVKPSEALVFRNESNPLTHMMVTAGGWGGNRVQDAVYPGLTVEKNDGTTLHTVTVRDVPLRELGFWSITVYGPTGFMIKDACRNSYNMKTAKANGDNSFTINFGGCSADCTEAAKTNCLAIVKGWRASARLYMPQDEIISGNWTFPKIVPSQ